VSRLVSIIIPSYNAERYLGETLRSATGQTWPRVEVLVIDDGSKDGTREVARGFEGPAVRVLGQSNRGAAAARNQGLREAQGDFIQFLDADDLLAPDKVERQVAALRDYPEGVAAAAWGRFTTDPAATRFVPMPVWESLDPVSWLVRSWTGGGAMFPAAWLLPRAVADRAGPWDERLTLNDDGEYFARVLLQSRGVRFCPKAICYYRAVAGSLSASRSRAAWESALLAMELGVAALRRAEDSPRTRQAAADRFQHLEYEAFLGHPEVSAAARRLVRELGGSRQRCPGGRVFRLLAGVVGWKAARRLQAGWQRRRQLSTHSRGR
jgi:glycosyltransferase involved in cell wall biosynthesis